MVKRERKEKDFSKNSLVVIAIFCSCPLFIILNESQNKTKQKTFTHNLMIINSVNSLFFDCRIGALALVVKTNPFLINQKIYILFFEYAIQINKQQILMDILVRKKKNRTHKYSISFLPD